MAIPGRMLARWVRDMHSDYDDGLNGWLDYEVTDLGDDLYLTITFLDGETDQYSEVAYKLEQTGYQSWGKKDE